MPCVFRLTHGAVQLQSLSFNAHYDEICQSNGLTIDLSDCPKWEPIFKKSAIKQTTNLHSPLCTPNTPNLTCTTCSLYCSDFDKDKALLVLVFFSKLYLRSQKLWNEAINKDESGGGHFYGIWGNKRPSPEIQLLLVCTWFSLNYCSIPAK